MRKRTYFKKKQHKPDWKHDRIDMGRFINYIMRDGERAIAEKVFYNSLDYVKETTKEDPIQVFEKALSNATPALETISRRIGGANYQIPREVRPERKFFLACYWIINAAKKKKGRPMYKKLGDELIAAAKNEGDAIKRKENTRRMAEANRAFASFLR